MHMKSKLAVIFFLISFFLFGFLINEHSKIPVRVFGGFICIPNGYYIFNENSEEDGVIYHPNNGENSIIKTGGIKYIPDPTVSDVIKWEVQERISIDDLSIVIYRVNKDHKPLSTHVLKTVLIFNEEEYLYLSGSDVNIWRDILDSSKDNPSSACRYINW